MGLIVEYFQKNKVPSADFVKLLRSSSNSINDSTVVKSLTFAVFYSINPEEAKQSLILDLDNQNDILLISRILEQDIINVSLPINVEEYIIKLCNSELIRIENQVDEFKFFESISSVKASKWAEVLQDTTNWSFLTTLWGNVKEEVQSHDQFTLIIASKKLKLFTMLNETTQNNLTDLKTLLEFNGILFKNSRAISKQSTTFYKVREEALAQVYKLIKQSISTSTNRDIINSILEIIDCNSLSPELNYSVAELLSILLEFTNSSEIIQIISGKLYELWSTLNAARLFLNQKDLHCLIIRTFYHASIINESKKLEEISCTLLKFSIEVIENSNGRRCLLPTLTKLISDFQLTNSIDGTSWLPEVLVRSYIVQQLTSNIFKLENVVGKVFDECLAVDQTSRLYSEVYGLEEISARINIMAILGTNTNEKFSKDVVQFITENQEEFKLYEVIKKTDGFEEWRRIQLMSVILIASNNIPIDEFVEQYYNTFVKLLETDPSPLVRNYIEWIACKCLLGNGVESPKHIENTFRVLKQLVDMNGGKPTLLTSYERILCMMIQQLPKEQEEELLTRFLTIVIPAATSNKAVTRHFSLSLMCSIHPQIVKKNLNLDVNLIKVLENMYQTAITSESFGQHRSGDATLWNVVKDMTLVSISGGVLLRVSDRDIDFITKESYEQNLSIEQKKALLFPIGENFEDLWITDRILQGNKKTLKHNTTAGSSIETTPLQTKSGALNSIVNVDDNNTINVVRSDLIVCASLVDKPPNLGGICRLSDVLGAGLLTLHDLKVKEHQQFKTVAVTADRWMPMVEVKPDGIIPYLMEKKKEGYTLIGLEQTDKSVQLNSELQFPKKSLILIGREKEGIPGDLLAELDFCVEIKQVGVIRSMNIQTATAIIVHAYSTQHC